MAVIKGMMRSWQDTYSARRVFGDPVENGDSTVIPVAMIAGGAGGGVGSSADMSEPGAGEGEGGGFGGMARPVGVYVVRADGVQWKPAVDVTMLGIAGIGLGALVAVILGWSLRRRR